MGGESSAEDIFRSDYKGLGTKVGTAPVKRNRESLDGRWDKHDGKDSANVADLISQGKCLSYEPWI